MSLLGIVWSWQISEWGVRVTASVRWALPPQGYLGESFRVIQSHLGAGTNYWLEIISRFKFRSWACRDTATRLRRKMSRRAIFHQCIIPWVNLPGCAEHWHGKEKPLALSSILSKRRKIHRSWRGRGCPFEKYRWRDTVETAPRSSIQLRRCLSTFYLFNE